MGVLSDYLTCFRSDHIAGLCHDGLFIQQSVRGIIVVGNGSANGYLLHNPIRRMGHLRCHHNRADYLSTQSEYPPIDTWNRIHHLEK